MPDEALDAIEETFPPDPLHYHIASRRIEAAGLLVRVDQLPFRTSRIELDIKRAILGMQEDLLMIGSLDAQITINDLSILDRV